MALTAIATATSSIISMAGDVMTIISENELLFTLFCGSLVTLACAVVRKVKKTAKA